MSSSKTPPAMTALTDAAAEAAIGAAAKTLCLPTIRDQAIPMAEAAAKQRLTHKAFLAEMLSAECDERDARRRMRRVNEAKFPRTKRLADFDPARLPDLPPATLAHLAGGAWIDAGEPLVLLGDSGTGKTHLLIALGTAAAEQGRRVRYITTAALVNELVEAADDKQLSRVAAATPDWTCCASTRSATSTSTHAGPNSSSRSSPRERNEPPSPAPPTLRSANGAPPSPTPDWPQQ